MIEEKLIVSDTNIFIDLISLNVLDKFFLLPCDICTTDFVINEIAWPEQRAEIGKHIKAKKLTVVSFNYKELLDINALKINSTISMTDCSVWYYAKKTGGRLITGDGKLRKSAEKDNVKVSGILYIFNNLVEYGIFSMPVAATLLKHLSIINPRLPKRECEKRIGTWRN
ncbi:MAG: hypothetical protein IKX50_08570 [Spirochaetia bacterium]|nr:hypothetical protein [Spirochaetia bacterium]MBR5017768.1 hypothetical protein [Spirochaetia bacterium]